MSQPPPPTPTQTPTKVHPSPHLLESAGTILFSPSLTKICILHLIKNPNPNLHLYVLPKGRRNLNESRKEAALRETFEETGFRAKFLSVDLRCRCTPPGGEGQGEGAGQEGKKEVVDVDIVDEVRLFRGAEGESIGVQVRELGGWKGVKFIWWFVAVATRTAGDEVERNDEAGDFGAVQSSGREKEHGIEGFTREGKGEEGVGVEWVSLDEVEAKLSFESDREIVKIAIGVVKGTKGLSGYLKERYEMREEEVIS